MENFKLYFIPTVPRGGTMGLQMDISPPPTPPPSHLQLLDAKTTFVESAGGGEGVGGTVDHGSCIEYVLLFLQG